MGEESANIFILIWTGFWTGRRADTFKPSARSGNETRLAQGNWEREHKQIRTLTPATFSYACWRNFKSAFNSEHFIILDSEGKQ